MDVEDDADCVFFQKMSDHGHYGKRRKGQSRQGIYVFTPDGEFLASINELSAERVLKTIQQGLEKWEQLPDERKRARASKSIEPKHRWEQFYPIGGLVLHVNVRDLPNSSDPKAERLPTRNRDTAWFSKSEVAKMIPVELDVGGSFEFSPAFVKRMARYHFVDNVNGQTQSFSKSQTASSRITGKVIRNDGRKLEIEISGATLGQVGDDRESGRGVKTKILGHAVFDKEKKSFREFELVAVGERWGRTRFNDRRHQLETTPIGYVFQMAAPDATPMIPGIIWDYDAPWIKGPEQ